MEKMVKDGMMVASNGLGEVPTMSDMNKIFQGIQA